MANGIVNAIARAHHCVFHRPHRNADARREIVALRIDQIAWIFSGIGSDASGENGGHGREIIAGVQGGKVVVLLRVGGKIFVAKAKEQGQIGQGPPTILGKSIPGILPQIRLLLGRLQRGLLRQTKQQVGKRGAGGRTSTVAAGGTGLLGEEAGKGVGSGHIAGIAEEVVMDAAKVSSIADVVLLVNPGDGFGNRDRLIGLKVRLLLVTLVNWLRVRLGRP